MMAVKLARDGFTFLRSGPRFVRKTPDLTFAIMFQSNRYNSAGRSASVTIHAGVISRKVSFWAKNHPSPRIQPSAPGPIAFAGGQIGNLVPVKNWLSWDFAGPETRAAVASDAVSAIREMAFPFFSAFEEGVDSVLAFADDDWMQMQPALTYALACGEKVKAEAALGRFLDNDPQFRAKFEQWKVKFQRDGVPLFYTGHAHDLAAFAVATMDDNR